MNPIIILSIVIVQMENEKQKRWLLYWIKAKERVVSQAAQYTVNQFFVKIEGNSLAGLNLLLLGACAVRYRYDHEIDLCRECNLVHDLFARIRDRFIAYLI